MANKRIQVSGDNGVTWATLPGNQGELTDEMGNVVDTIFGQEWESQLATLGQWQITANGLYKGVAGYNALIKKAGAALAMTDEAMTLVSGKTYQITASAKRVLDLATSITVEDNAVDATAEVEKIDYLSGKVTFKGTYVPTGPVTLTGSYVPMSQIAKGRSFNLTQNANELDVTGYDDAQSNDGYRIFEAGLRTVSLELGGISRASTGWRNQLIAREKLMITVDLDASDPGKSMFAGYFSIMNRGQSGNQGDVEAETVQLQLYAPDGELIQRPFGWDIAANSRMNAALKVCLTAYENATPIKVRYLPSGAIGQAPPDGAEGTAYVTEASLANAIDGQNEFSFTFRGSDTPIVV
ncbi:hypothetical protein STASHLEY_00350 [Brevundimonas phage vB_BpoS-StAshley]|nr:hypothetical protein STASHLEY_00350 [Brevundimonas phage vB_BpoS-StAshley]